jgi:hypothetical protein
VRTRHFVKPASHVLFTPIEPYYIQANIIW